MKKIAKTINYKRITVLLLIVLLCNFLLPQYTFANEDNKTENHLANFFCAVGDVVLSVLQGQIVGNPALKYSGETQYSIKYSPGIIFSGTLGVFDINFIKPIKEQEKYVVKEEEKVKEARFTAVKVENAEDEIVAEFCTANKEYDLTDVVWKSAEQYNPNEDLIKKSDVISYMQKLQDENGFFEQEVEQKVQVDDIDITKEEKVYSWWLIENGNELEQYIIYVSNTIDNSTSSTLLRVYEVKLTKTILEKKSAVVSIASIMRNTIASWYKVMQEIALVGLLCVLIYVGVRGLISSSTEDKAKYKKMLFDWLVAVIIVLTLHYIISFTLTVTQKISDIFNANIIGDDGRDIIFSELRTKVGEENFTSNFINTVMYYTFIIMTIKYTIQYFKRVVYMAFLTMIAPIIGLTYPLDKIKDGQAQAFTLWIREFVFNALIQPLHLLLYYVFVGSSVMGSFAQDYPFYGLIVMAFLGAAEKMLKKMFGFDKGGKLGSLESAFGGAAVMNMINQLGGKSSKSSGGSNKGASNNEDNSKVRMANDNTSDYYSALKQTNVSDRKIGETSPKGKTQKDTGSRKLQPEIIPQNKKDNVENINNNLLENKSIKNSPNTSKGKKKKTRNQQIKERARKGAAIVAAQREQAKNNQTQSSNLLTQKSKKNSITNNNSASKQQNKKMVRTQGENNNVTSRPQAVSNNTNVRQQNVGNEGIRTQGENNSVTSKTQAASNNTNVRQQSVGNEGIRTQGENNSVTSRQQAASNNTNVRQQSENNTRTDTSQSKNNIDDRRDREGSTIKGITNVGKKVFKGTAKGALSATLRVASMATVGTFSLAYGLAEGDLEKAISTTAVGIAAGNKLGKNIANSATNAGRSLRNSARNIRDTYNEGKYGEREAQRRKAANEFKNGKEYQKLLNKHPGAEETIDKFLNAGITDAKKIRTALDNSNNYSTDNAIAYMHMAKVCPSKIFEDRDKFETYLESNGIPKEKAEEIYRAVREYR